MENSLNLNTKDYSIIDGVFKGLSSDFTDFCIPEGVTTITAGSFKNCQKLYRVTLPSTLKNIEPNAFQGCTCLVEIINRSSLPLKTTYGSFGGVCDNAKSVVTDQKDSVISVTKDKLVLLKTSDGLAVVTYLGRKKQIVIPDSVTEISKEAFYSSSCESVILPSTLKRIGGKAFYCSKIKKMTLPASVETLYERVFDCCEIVELNVLNPEIYFYPEILNHAYDLTTVRFAGTKSQWENLFDDRDTQPYSASFTVTFANGETKEY